MGNNVRQVHKIFFHKRTMSNMVGLVSERGQVASSAVLL